MGKLIVSFIGNLYKIGKLLLSLGVLNAVFSVYIWRHDLLLGAMFVDTRKFTLAITSL